MSIMKGDIKRALGYGSIKIGEGDKTIEIDLSKTTAKDIVEFQELPIRITQGKKADELTAEDLIKAGEISSKWYVDYFMAKDPNANKEDMHHFVVRNRQALQKEFTIGFGIKPREQYDKDESEAEEKLLKKD